MDFVLRHIQSNWRRLPLPGILSQLLGDSDPLSPDSKPPVPRKGHGLHALIMDEKPVPEADAYRIAALALEDLDRYLQDSVVSNFCASFFVTCLAYSSVFMEFMMLSEGHMCTNCRNFVKPVS